MMSPRIAFLMLALICGAAQVVAQPKLVIGTYQKGSNLTEPRPKKSEYLETMHGGIVLIEDVAGFYLFAKVIKHPERELYLRIEYEDPSGREPLVNDMRFMPDADELHFSAPHGVRGLKSYGDYQIVVKVFDSKDAREPLDTLKQTVRSYVDTRGEKPKLFKRLKEK
jgi:hypothetical protein